VPEKLRRFQGPRPRKELGQHFLLDEEIAERIVRSLNLRWDERALEIGPGRGVLLRFLLKACRHVTAVELDQRLKKTLQTRFGGHPGLELIFADFMRFDLEGYLLRETSPVRLVGNIPYSLSSPILFRLFETVDALLERKAAPLKCAVLMLQKEVARRICAEPGNRSYGAITVFRALVADAEPLFDVPPDAFHPPPAVVSSVVRLDFFPERKYRLSDAGLFRSFVHHLFAQKRKMIKNTLHSLDGLHPRRREIDLDLTRRPEELNVDQWIRLFDQVYPENPDRE
jgi:16S rRNA (adenine1518-N6/adenine1519-N6)-dimethyltransferase